MKLLFVASELDGIVKTGGLADFARSLPLAMKQRGHDVRVVMPKYRIAQSPRLTGSNTLDFKLNHTDWYGAHVFHTRLNTIPIRLVEHHHFFSRDGIYDNGYNSYPDNALRYAFLCKSALEQCLQEDWIPDILHCNDWQTALVPYYLKNHFPHELRFKNTTSVLTVHNGAFQGKTEAKLLSSLGINTDQFDNGQAEHSGLINLLKCGILSADKVNAVSPGYYQELLNDNTSHGLGYCYRQKANDFTGILNGCDYDQWDPKKDPHLVQGFSQENLSGKKRCKAHLQKQMHLPADRDIPLFGMVSRLTDQKGFDYLIPAMEMVLNQGFFGQFALLGSGNPEYGTLLHHLQNRFPKNLSFVNGYDVGLSHEIEAGADFFMMPSLFEPCGLNQLYSLAYGTLPIVRCTGGLKDTIVGLHADLSNTGDATGLDFDFPAPTGMADVLNRATILYTKNKEVYDKLQQTAMGKLFTWEQCAEKYEILYKSK